MTKATTPKKSTKAATPKKTSISKKPDHPKELKDLHDVGEKTIKDLNMIGIKTIQDLRGKKAEDLFHQLEAKRPAVSIRSLYTFEACIAQVDNPDIPSDEKKWKFYSEKHKKEGTAPEKSKAKLKTTRGTRSKKPAEAEEAEESA